ncbi:YcaO-like family protein [Arcanobacterium ihumii]|uniref:YcaO-like family protein n=1 Tax=Arcanobacterium ihumii TaxID=2138162 RepID=UPI00135BED34|nr:YcaO-like family protein [Arcanobacterium ihumii]
MDISIDLDANPVKIAPLSAYANSSGTAAGLTIEDAALHALNEIIERDAESQFLLDVYRNPDRIRTVVLESQDPLNQNIKHISDLSNGSVSIYLLESLAGFVFCAATEPRNNEGILGFGSSQYPRLALIRALTELQQYYCATERGATWQDEGGFPLEQLSKYPNMQRIATRIFPLDGFSSIDFDHIQKDQIALESPVDTLKQKGFTSYARLAWQSEDKQVCTVQIIVPGAESLCNLVLGRPILPTGRLHNTSNIQYLRSPQDLTSQNMTL